MSFLETILLLSSKLSRVCGYAIDCCCMLYSRISHIVVTCSDSPQPYVSSTLLRGSALAAATDGDPVLGKQAILALMEAVSETQSAFSTLIAKN